MNYKSTPETNAAIFKVYEGPLFSPTVSEVVDPNVSRKLERQRDEARELARELRDALERLSNHGHADDCFLINRADGQCDCGVEGAQMLLHRAKEVLP